MSTKILELTIENALKAHREGDSRDKLLLEKLYGTQVFNMKITDRVKTMQDVYSIVSQNLSAYLPVNSSLEEFIKYPANRIELLSKVLNEGWKPDWNNGSEQKFYPWFEWKQGAFGFSFSDCVYDCQLSRVGSRLCFKTRTLAEYAGQQFTKEYNEFLSY